jgi:hypothetical protein
MRRAPSRRSSPARSLFAASLFAASLITGCGFNDIGDECSTDTQCGTGRICDRTSEGGYCTIPDCEADSCPENSVCVEFANEESYCMALCDDGECREDYVCDTENGAAPFCREARN